MIFPENVSSSKEKKLTFPLRLKNIQIKSSDYI